jgi:hypothetical protein
MLHRPLYRFLGRLLKRFDRRKIALKLLMDADFSYGIQNARLINSRSLLFSCDVYPNNPHSSIANIPYLDSILDRLASYRTLHPVTRPSIYIPSDGLIYFAQQILPCIHTEFVLVSGDSDLAINEANLGSHLDLLLKSPFILSWHAQNRDYDHHKLHSLPIGINIHNLWANPLQWGGGFILPSLQELQIQTIAENAPDFLNREQKVFCNWHFSIDRADRKDCLVQIDQSVCYFQPEPLPTAKTWEMQSNYQFVLSPHGAGLDCHRTWEALLLGCIPIIKAAKLNDLFTDLPVIVVNDWREINSVLLKESMQKLRQPNNGMNKVLMHYWKKQITTSKLA